MADIIIREERHRQTAIERIQALSLTREWSVTIKPYEKRRSVQANSLMHMWFSQIALEIGDTPDSVKAELKAMFAPRVENYSHITKLTTFVPKATSKMTVKELSEFMTAVSGWAASFQGISLPSPEDLGRD